MGLSANRASVCAFGLTDCPEAPPGVRLTLSVAPAPPAISSPRAEVLFLLEVSPWMYGCTGNPAGNGCLVHGATDAAGIFLANASRIAFQVTQRNPMLNVSFGFAFTAGGVPGTEDGDEPALRVVTPQFRNATTFDAGLNNTTSRWADTDSSDLTLVSGAVPALYASLQGEPAGPGAGDPNLAIGLGVYGQVNWTNGTRHIVVLVGAMAPTDRNYSEASCALLVVSSSGCEANTSVGLLPQCAQSYNFTGGLEPSCEGWVSSQTSNASASIAALARTAPSCLHAAYGRCIVDDVTVNATPTDPASADWRTGPALARSWAINDTTHAVEAGCDLATRTGGSWAGPWGAHCGNVTGTLNLTSKTSGPGLVAALENISLGVAPNPIVAEGVPGAPLVEFATAPGWGLAGDWNGTSHCHTPAGPLAACPSATVIASGPNGTVLGWNWSTNSSANFLTSGDVWNASFDLVATEGPTVGPVPVDGCTPMVNGTCASGVHYFAWGAFGPAVAAFPSLDLSIAPASNLSVRAPRVPLVAEAGSSVSLAIEVAGGYPPYSYRWRLGDGTSALTSAPFVNHTFASSGVSEVQTAVTDRQGDSATAIFWMEVLPALELRLAATSVNGTAPLDVAFDATALGGSGPYNISWTFANGDTGTGPSVVTRFDMAGSYEVTASLTDSAGYSTSAAITVQVAPPLPGPVPLGAAPTADLLAGNDSCAALVAFSAGVTGGAAPYNERWRFGDGGTAVGAAPVHRYLSSGSFTATVDVTDSAGATASGSVPVSVTLPGNRACATTTPPVPPALSPLVIVALVALGGLVAAGVAGTFRRRRS